MLVYNPIAPAATAPDVAQFEFIARVDGQPDQVVTQDVGGVAPELKFPDNTLVHLFCVCIDDSDNRSGESPPFDFTATDTIPPGAPDAPSVVVVREE